MGFLYLILFVAFIYVDYIIAKTFADIAEMKGHIGEKYFWFTFLLGPVGMLMVIALPIQTAITKDTKSKTQTNLAECNNIPQKEQADAENNCTGLQLRVLDIEQAVSTYLNKPISISDIECTLLYVIPKSTGQPKEMHLDMVVGDKEFSSLDLKFFNPKKKAYYIRGKRLALDEAKLPAEKIFDFNISLFKTFKTEVDSSD